jgi:hypothetical protein
LPGTLPALSKYPKTARRSDFSAAIAASECSGEWWIWEMSCEVVTPASSWLSEPNSSLM